MEEAFGLTQAAGLLVLAAGLAAGGAAALSKLMYGTYNPVEGRQRAKEIAAANKVRAALHTSCSSGRRCSPLSTRADWPSHAATVPRQMLNMFEESRAELLFHIGWARVRSRHAARIARTG